MSQRGYSRRPSRGIEHFFRETLNNDEKPNIFNLDSYFSRNSNSKFNRNYYQHCKKFINDINNIVGAELDSNTGNVINAFGIDGNNAEDNAELENIKNNKFDITY
jgi:hypothetical protein